LGDMCKVFHGGFVTVEIFSLPCFLSLPLENHANLAKIKGCPPFSSYLNYGSHFFNFDCSLFVLNHFFYFVFNLIP